MIIHNEIIENATLAKEDFSIFIRNRRKASITILKLSIKTVVTQCEPVYNGHLKDIDKWSLYRDAVLKTFKN